MFTPASVDNSMQCMEIIIFSFNRSREPNIIDIYSRSANVPNGIRSIVPYFLNM